MKSKDIKNWRGELSYTQMAALEDFEELLGDAIVKDCCLLCEGNKVGGGGLCLGCERQINGKDRDALEKIKKYYKEKSSNSSSFLFYLVAIGSAIVGLIVGRLLGLIYFLFFAVGYLGWYLASLYSKKYSENKFSRFIAWINLVTWLIPLVGFFTVFATFKFNQAYGKKTKLYRVLAIIGLVACVINGAIGIIIKL